MKEIRLRLDNSDYEDLRVDAKALGFPSVSSYIRFMTKTSVWRLHGMPYFDYAEVLGHLTNQLLSALQRVVRECQIKPQVEEGRDNVLPEGQV